MHSSLKGVDKGRPVEIMTTMATRSHLPRSTGETPRLDATLALLRACEGELRAAGVCHAAVFGSVARGDAVADSDVDVLVELDPHVKVGLEFFGIEARLAELFGRRVDLVSRGGLRPALDDDILRDAVEAF